MDLVRTIEAAGALEGEAVLARLQLALAPRDGGGGEGETPPDDARLCVRSGASLFALPLRQTREVAAPPAMISRIPRMAPPILGAISLRGRVAVLTDLAGLLGQSLRVSGETIDGGGFDDDLARVVLLEGAAVALRVDEVRGIAAASALKPIAGLEILDPKDLIERVERLLTSRRPYRPGMGAKNLAYGSEDPSP